MNFLKRVLGNPTLRATAVAVAGAAWSALVHYVSVSNPGVLPGTTWLGGAGAAVTSGALLSVVAHLTPTPSDTANKQ